MNRCARAFVFVLLLAAASLGAGCSGSIGDGKFNPDGFWKDHDRDAVAAE